MINLLLLFGSIFSILTMSIYIYGAKKYQNWGWPWRK